MPKKKKSSHQPKMHYGRRKNSKSKKKKIEHVNTAILQQKYKDLQCKFKLKELRIILHDIANNTTSPQQKSSDKNIDSLKIIDKFEKNTSQNVYSRDKNSPINDTINTENCNERSSAVAIEKYDIDKKKTEKQNIDNGFDIQDKLLNAEGQRTCFDEHIGLLPISESISKKKEEECRAENYVGCTLTPENIDNPIAATNSNQNLYSDLLTEIISVPNIHTKITEEQNINFIEQNEETCIKDKNLMKDRYFIEHTDEEPLKETQKILLTQEDNNKVHKQNSLKRRHLPIITEDKLLAKNTILLKTQDNVQIANNFNGTAYNTNAVFQNKSNECLSVEKYSRVADLTEDNLYKFMENYNKCLASEENIISINITENHQSSENSNSTEIILKTSNNDLHTPYKKRGWIPQKTTEAPEKNGNKRIKLNRRHMQEKSSISTKNYVHPSDNKNSNSFSKCQNINVNNERVQDADDRLTLYSNNGNSLCTILLVTESIKDGIDGILRSTHDMERNISVNSHTTLNVESEKNELLLTEESHQNAKNIVENNLNEGKILSCSTQLDPQNQVECKINDVHDDGDNDVDQNNDGVNEESNNNNGGDNGNCSNDDDDDDDCISLFTDSLLSVDLMDIPSNESDTKNPVQDYKMTGNTFNNYLQQNILEFNKEFETIEKSDTLIDNSHQKSCQEEHTEIEQNNTNSTSSHVINNNNSLYPDKNHNNHTENVVYGNTSPTTCTEQMEPIECQTLCKGFCFAKMRTGDCTRISCYFNHDLQTLIRNISLKYKQYLTSIIHYAYSMKYHYFLKRLYHQSLQECNVACIMDLYEKLYSIQYLHADMVCITVETLLGKGMHPKDVVDGLCRNLIPTDNWISLYILNAIKDKLEVGEYWNTLRSLLTYVKPPKEVVESILNDCLITRQHIQDVHINLIQRLHPLEVNQLNKDLMLSFDNLLKPEHQNIPYETSPELVNDNKESSEESYVLQSISDLPETHSQYRDRFWKLYLMIHNIKEALIHEDYDYVISILNKYETINEDESLFSRCCFHMLTAEIKHSEYHISKIIEHAVQTGASSILYKVLLDIATYILMKLIVENAWTLAYKLLKTLQIYKLQHSAAFIILSAEIYVANQHAIKALMLIKQSNIISTNRDNWNVESNAQDYDPRTNILGILLDVLCIKSPEHAFFVFQFLTKDQGNNFRPIDLTHYVDKLMLKLLIIREIDLIVKMGYMILEYNFTFFNITICRAAIASLVHIDMVLAKQLYQYASGLGIYRTIEILPVIHVIINVDWVEEEIYLTFWDLFKRLVMDIGHSIDHLNHTQLSVYIIFEIVPTEAHLYRENLDDQQKNKIQMSKKLVRQVLSSRFEPSIFVSKKKTNGKIIKLQNKDVINYLKAICDTYIE